MSGHLWRLPSRPDTRGEGRVLRQGAGRVFRTLRVLFRLERLSGAFMFTYIGKKHETDSKRADLACKACPTFLAPQGSTVGLRRRLPPTFPSFPSPWHQMNDAAVPLFEAALDIRTRVLGADHSDTVDSRAGLERARGERAISPSKDPE